MSFRSRLNAAVLQIRRADHKRAAQGSLPRRPAPDPASAPRPAVKPKATQAPAAAQDLNPFRPGWKHPQLSQPIRPKQALDARPADRIV